MFSGVMNLNSGMFGDGSVLDLSGDGPMFWSTSGLASKYLFLLSGIEDRVSKNALTDTSAGSVYYIHPTTGELVTVAATEVLNHPVLGITSLPSYEQLCQDSEDPGEWVPANAIFAYTGLNFGPFKEGTLTDAGSLTDGPRIWESGLSGHPSGILYFSIRYNIGTSGRIFVYTYDSDSIGLNQYSGIIGSAEKTTTDGTFTIISDEYYPELGYYIVTGSILFSNLSNTLKLGIGPYSTDNSNIKILGADVSEDRSILDFHVPSGPATGNVTIASRAGTVSAADLVGSFPKLYDGLDGVVADDAVELWVAITAETGWTDNEDGSYTCDGTDYAALTTLVDIEIGTYLELKYTLTPGYTGLVGLSSASYAGSNTFYGSGTFTRRDIAVNNFPIRFNPGTNFIGTISNISVKQISTAAIRMSGSWTPGQNHADWTAVRSIFTGSDVDHLLQANATGGIVLDDGTTTATVDVDFTAGVEYPIEIVAGPNTADGKDEMQLNVYFSGAWHSDIQDFVGTFGPDTAAIFGLSNTYQSSVKNLVCEKLTQDMWRS